MAFDYQEAKRRGYSDSQIRKFLESKGANPEEYMPRSSGADNDIRSLGLGTRSTIKGLAGLPTVLADSLGHAINYGIYGINKAFDTDIGYLPKTSASIDQGLTQLGLPTPQTDKEKLYAAMQEGGASVLGSYGLGGLAKQGGQVAQKVGQVMQAEPAKQMTAALAGAGATEAAAQQGAGPVTQSLVGLGAGIMAPSALAGGKHLAGSGLRGTKAMINPLSRAGQEHIVGNTLRQMAGNDEAAINALRQGRNIIPGSQQTLAQRTQDLGLASAERSMMNTRTASRDAAADFAERFSQQNTARSQLMDFLAGTDDDLELAITRRSQAARKAVEGIKTQSTGKQINTKPAIDYIDDVLKSGDGKNPAIERALKQVRAKLHNEGGDLETDFDQVYGVRKFANRGFNKSIDKFNATPEEKDLLQAGYHLKKINGILDNQIDEAGIPGFRQYMDKFSDASSPIERMQVLQKMNKDLRNAKIDTEGNYFISQPKLMRQLMKKEKELKKVLSPEQMTWLRKILKDMDKGLVHDKIKPRGSDTFSNMTGANVIGEMLAGRGDTAPEFIKPLLRPLNWIYQVPDETMHGMLVDAFLDPELALRLMSKGTPKNIEMISESLKRAFTARTVGAGLGTATNVE